MVCRVPEEEITWIRKWLIDHAPVRSGSESERHIQWGTWGELYKNYVSAVEQYYAPRSLFFIRTQVDKRNIQLAKFDHYICPICWQGNHPTDEHYGDQREALLERYPSHHELVGFTSRLYKHQTTQIKPGEVLLIYDYTRFHESSVVKAHDLGVVMRTTTMTKYFDFFAEAAHDYRYTRAVMEYFWENEAELRLATRIRIWSDGALKTKENIFLFGELQAKYGVPIEVFSFAPYHGHSLADGHFGVGKRSLRKKFADNLVATLADIEQQFAPMTNTTTFIFDKIPAESINVAPIPGIRSFFAFTFPDAGIVECWTRYVQGETPVLLPLQKK